ncbi:MAG: FKBP-type peptidyl-prolyl cis-trans isomerase [Gammaproteobacteria bacterium]|nr:FKBP-type peptidyl-prolyl cis-trans isomerase [Gammaproteobacteria bacterium]MBU1415076.1 FKBP-type peptidyl-prolyl cis-trans isomerase [Gammaproteobacteria bacterium]
MADRVKTDSLVTLHYRLATGDDVALVSTFDGTPATLQLGSGELVPTLEACIEGMAVGERQTFLLESEQAFGPHSPELVQRFLRSDLPDEGNLEPLNMIEFSGPDGLHITGLVRELDADSALIDFNHPLAGRDVRFEVEIVGIL